MRHRKILGATILGNILEYYDFMLFSFFISVLSPLYFPAENHLSALLLGFTVFALGFLARPLGALAFGTLGDKWGRQKTLSLTIFLMAGPTVVIGLLPTYQDVGIFAPIVLTVCRILQGFAAGGEANGAAIYLLEHTPHHTRGFWGAMLTSSAGLGALLATGVGAIFTLSLFPDWAWRLPFILGGLLGYVGYYIRKGLSETPEFRAIQPLKTLPILEVLANARTPFLKAVAVGALINVPFYAIIGYMNPLLHARGHVSQPEMLIMNAMILVVAICVIPMMGAVGDRVGHHKIMAHTCKALILVSFVTFWTFETGGYWAIFLAQLLLLATAEGYVAPANAYLHSLFPTEYRYTGIAFACCIGTALCAGTAPLFCTLLSESIHPAFGPALYIAGLSFISLIALSLGIFEAEEIIEDELVTETPT